MAKATSKKGSKGAATKVRGKKETGKKDASKKPRTLSAFFIFAKEHREQYLKEHPEKKSEVAQIAKLAGEKWRAMDDAQKTKYKQQAAKIKADAEAAADKAPKKEKTEKAEESEAEGSD